MRKISECYAIVNSSIPPKENIKYSIRINEVERKITIKKDLKLKMFQNNFVSLINVSKKTHLRHIVRIKE